MALEGSSSIRRLHCVAVIMGMDKLHDAIGSRPRGLPAAAWPDPVGCFVSGQHVADAGDPAVWAADHGELLQCDGGPGAIPQQVFQRLTLDTQMGTKERDPDTGVDCGRADAGESASLVPPAARNGGTPRGLRAGGVGFARETL